jgi:tight adherence protein C
MPESSAHIFAAAMLIGSGISLVIAGISHLLRTGRPRLQRRVRDLRHDEIDGDASLTRRLLEGVSRLPGLRECSRGLRDELAAAGIASPSFLGGFLAMQLTLSVVLAGTGTLLGLGHQGESASTYAAMYALTGLVLGFYLPRMWLEARRRQHLAAIQLTLPDAIDLLVVCVEAGMGLNAALLRVAAEIGHNAPELRAELDRLNQEIRAGQARVDALRALTVRAPIADLESVVGVLIQAENTGSSITAPLRNQAHLLRMRRRQRAEERARQATVKLILPLTFCVFPVILIVLLGPALWELLQAFRSFSG